MVGAWGGPATRWSRNVPRQGGGEGGGAPPLLAPPLLLVPASGGAAPLLLPPVLPPPSGGAAPLLLPPPLLLVTPPSQSSPTQVAGSPLGPPLETGMPGPASPPAGGQGCVAVLPELDGAPELELSPELLPPPSPVSHLQPTVPLQYVSERECLLQGVTVPLHDMLSKSG